MLDIIIPLAIIGTIITGVAIDAYISYKRGYLCCSENTK